LPSNFDNPKGDTTVRDDKELAATIQQAMRERGLDREGLAKRLSVSSVMMDKIIRGEVIPSRYLERQMKEVLGIPEPTIRRMVERRELEEHREREGTGQESKERRKRAA
jgi:ribosome-binding protein aMBF1 (putative translation factor)